MTTRWTRTWLKHMMVAMVAVVVVATACSATPEVTTSGDTAATGSAGSDGSTTGSTDGTDGAEPARIRPALAATIPDDICRDGEMLPGVVDREWLVATGLAEDPRPSVQPPHTVADWQEDPLHECSVDLVFRGPSLRFSISHFDGNLDRFGEIDSSAVIGGVPVDFLTKGDSVMYARAVWPDPASELGTATFLISYQVVPEVDVDEARALLTTVAERVIPNVTYVAPPFGDGPGATPEPEPTVDSTNEYEVWLAESKEQWVIDCNAGDLYACDFLWYVSGRDTVELEVGMSCGGTREATANSRCLSFSDPGEPLNEGDHPLLDRFTAECRSGDELSCRKLSALASGASGYYGYADGCLAEIRAEPGPCSIEFEEW